ncbi:hypothetical protein [uncultured Roseibium sp.]|uniref:hypothetical protein n=1 Tax=uncultured Roseibium sp. TaxID=1936171 RepID=UPI00321678D1
MACWSKGGNAHPLGPAGARFKAQITTMRRDLSRIERKSNRFLGWIVETDSSSLVTASENKVRELETQKRSLDGKDRKLRATRHELRGDLSNSVHIPR